MRIALIQCPAWVTHSPPYGLAVISSELKKDNHSIKCFDINIMLYNKFANNSRRDIANMWNTENIDDFWTCEENVKMIIKDSSVSINETINDLTQFDPEIICFSVYYTNLISKYPIYFVYLHHGKTSNNFSKRKS